MYGQFTMETIMATAFGRVLNLQRGEGDQLTEAANAIFSGVRSDATFSLARISLLMG